MNTFISNSTYYNTIAHNMSKFHTCKHFDSSMIQEPQFIVEENKITTAQSNITNSDKLEKHKAWISQLQFCIMLEDKSIMEHN
jgi:hypothetical protein